MITTPEEIRSLLRDVTLTLFDPQTPEFHQIVNSLKRLKIVQGVAKEKLSAMDQYEQLGRNQLTKLPKEIGKLVKLEKLQIEVAKLTELPKEIGLLKNIKFLYIEMSQLTNLPEEITQLKNLEGFSIAHNKLKEENLSKEIIDWLDENDSDWRETQNVDIKIRK